MSIYDQDYNRIDVRFRHARFGWLQMMVRTRDAGIAAAQLIEHERRFGKAWRPWPTQHISCRISGVFCPFPSLLAWLEAMASGVQRCAFTIDGEGSEAEIEWRGRVLAISQPENCYRDNREMTWYRRELAVLANRRQVIAGFYSAFRSFAESDEYQPASYEGDLRGEEYASQRIKQRLSPEALIGFLVGLDAPTVEFFYQWARLPYPPEVEVRTASWATPDEASLLRAFNGILAESDVEQELARLAQLGEPPMHRYIPLAWNRMDAPRRAVLLRELLRWPIGHNSGSPLRSLRSERVEAYLRAPTDRNPVVTTRMKLFQKPVPLPEAPAPFVPAIEVRKIVSGGQTGADRAALDWAIERGYEHGGWCPKGRRAEDGVIDSRYQLMETESAGYMLRTKCNVRDSQGTLIVNLGDLDGGSRQTFRYAERISSPVLVAAVDDGISGELVERVRRWARTFGIYTLNVAGPRENKRHGIYDQTRLLLDAAFGPARDGLTIKQESRP